MSELRAMVPCPFCGRADLLHVEPVPVSGFLAVKCWVCGTHGPSGRSQTEDEAVAHWNRADRKLSAETLDDDIAFLDRAVTARILDLRRDATLDGIPISEENHREMNGVARAWDRIRLRFGRR